MNTKFCIQSIPYLPFLIALFIGVSIYVPNRTYFPVDVMILPMGILFSLIGIALIILKFAQVNLNKSQILISCALILNFIYFILHDFLYDVNLSEWFYLASITYALLFVLIIAVVWKTTSFQACNLSLILNVIAIFAVLISLANFGFSMRSEPDEVKSVEQDQEFEGQFQKDLAVNLTTPLNSRDFYFIILDRYPGEDTLYAEYGFNNSDFYQNLSSMGFTVLRGSKSNYGITSRSIPSMLNMDHYNSLKKTRYNEEYNRLWIFFKKQGFTFVYLPSNWYTTVENDNADITLNSFFMQRVRLSPYFTFQKIMFFERTFIGKVFYFTMYKLFNQEMPSSSIEELQIRIRNGNNIYDGNKFYSERTHFYETELIRSHVLNTFENLTHVPKIPGKKFTVSHIDRWTDIEKSQLYLDKIRTVNQLTEWMLREIISKSEIDPVIVLMSDHGCKANAGAIKENASIFAKYACYPNESLSKDYIFASWYNVNNIEAFYLPESGNNSIYSGMTPVNAWRMILNYYFRTDFPRTGDQSYWYSPNGLCEVARV
jgi:hypothetical protein